LDGQQWCRFENGSIDGTDVGDHVDLEGKGQHVRVKTSLRELGGLLGGLSLLEDGLQGLKRVLDRHNGGIVDRVGHFEGCVVRGWIVVDGVLERCKHALRGDYGYINIPPMH
jgi:hypothetical protein